MWKQIKLLTSIQTCNIYGRNESRYSRDDRKRSSNEVSFAAQMLNFIMFGGVSALVAGSFILSGIADSIPVLAFFIASIVILVFTIMQSGDTLYQLGTFEMLLSLPVSQGAVVASRFLYMYVTNFIWGAVIMTPAMIVYCVAKMPGVLFYLDCMIGIIIMPFIPMVIGSLAGALAKSKTARMRHGKVASAVMNILFVIPAVVLWMVFNRMMGQGNGGAVRHVAELIDIWSGRLYPFALWFGKSTDGGDPLYMLLTVAVSAAAFYVMIQVLQKNYLQICMAVNGNSARKNYKMEKLDQSSVMKSLVTREWRHYISSSAYISGTLMLYVMTVVLAVALLLLGTKTVENFTGLYAIDVVFPFVVAFFMSTTPLTMATFSMEGRQWWILQSLPLKSRDIINSKLIISVLVIAPFYMAVMVIGGIAIRPGMADGAAGILVSSAYILFNTVLALVVNIRYPKMDWEDENKAMRNNTSTMILMLLNTVIVLVPAVATGLFRHYAALIMTVTAVVILVITGIMRSGVLKKSLINIR